MKKIGYLGAGTWGFSLACLLASKGNQVTLWSIIPEVTEALLTTREHPNLPGMKAPENLIVTDDLKQTLEGADYIVESVTSSGVRPVFEQVLALGNVSCPIIITSKGIEQNSGLLLPEVVLQVLGDDHRDKIACISGPTHAEEVIKSLPSVLVGTAYDKQLMYEVCDLFVTSTFRMYPNYDINGVAFGGAMKNIVAVACGISDGLGFGDNTKAALITRGLHEIRKLSSTKGCNPETLNGLAGLGDLCVTCMSVHSRNYRFGRFLAEGLDPKAAKEKVGQAVEGIYSCVSALQLSEKANIPVPITEAVYKVVYDGIDPREAVKVLFQREIKDEHL